MAEVLQPKQPALGIGWVEQILQGCTVLLALATLAWFVSGLNRGLELTDDSYYLLSAIHADQVKLFFSPAHWVSGWLWQISQSLAGFRALGLALAVLSSWVLAWGALRLATAARLLLAPISGSSQLALYASSSSAALLYGSLLNFTPSYNLLAASGACFAAGLGFRLISANRDSRHVVLLAAACGIALGMTVLCKFSSGISTAALLVGMQLAWNWRQHPPLRFFWPMLLALVCAAATVLLAMLLQTGYGEALRQFYAGIALVWFAQGDHSTSGRLLRSAADMGSLGVATLRNFWGPLLCFALSAFWRPLWMAGLGLVWLVVLMAAGNLLTAGVFVAGNPATTQAAPLAALLACMLLLTARRWLLQSYRPVLLVLALLVLPVGIAIGTWNPMQIQILAALAPWGVLLGLLVALAAGLPEPRLRLVAAACAALFGLVVLLQIHGSAERPYRMQPLALQTEQVAIGKLGVVKVDSQTAALVRAMQLAGQRCGIAPGRPFVDLYNLPAVGLMLDAVPVVSPWLLNADYADVVLRQADPAVLARAIIVTRQDKSGKESLIRPPSLWANFPAGYRFCGQATMPIDGAKVALWAPD